MDIKEIAEKLKEQIEMYLLVALTPMEAQILIDYIEEKEKRLQDCDSCKYAEIITSSHCVGCIHTNNSIHTFKWNYSNWQPKHKVEVVNVPDPGNDRYGEDSIPATHA